MGWFSHFENVGIKKELKQIQREWSLVREIEHILKIKKNCITQLESTKPKLLIGGKTVENGQYLSLEADLVRLQKLLEEKYEKLKNQLKEDHQVVIKYYKQIHGRDITIKQRLSEADIFK